MNYDYPLLVFKDNDKNIYGIAKDFGIVSKGGERFYQNLTVVDSKGSVFILRKAIVKGVAPFGICLKYFQKMWKMELVFDQTEQTSLEAIKSKIITHIAKNPKHWLTLDTLEAIKQRVDSVKSFKDLALMFR